MTSKSAQFPTLAGLVVALGMPTQAAAWGGDYCTTGAIKACASVYVTSAPAPDGRTAIVILMRNLQGTVGRDNTGGSRIYAINARFPNPYSSEETPGSWTDYNSTGAGLPPDWNGNETGSAIGAVGKVGGPEGGEWNGPGWDNWDMQPGWDSADWDDEWRPLGIFGCDYEGLLTHSGTITCARDGWDGFAVFTFLLPEGVGAEGLTVSWGVAGNGFNGGCTVSASGSESFLLGSEAPCEVIPEPVTMVLLGTGLAGLGGVGLIRRRKKDELV